MTSSRLTNITFHYRIWRKPLFVCFYLKIPKSLITQPLVDIVLDGRDGELDGLVGRLQDLVAARKSGQDVAVRLSHRTIEANLEKFNLSLSDYVLLTFQRFETLK